MPGFLNGSVSPAHSWPKLAEFSHSSGSKFVVGGHRVSGFSGNLLRNRFFALGVREDWHNHCYWLPCPHPCIAVLWGDKTERAVRPKGLADRSGGSRSAGSVEPLSFISGKVWRQWLRAISWLVALHNQKSSYPGGVTECRFFSPLVCQKVSTLHG